MGASGGGITPDWGSYISQGGNLYNQALSEVHPSAAVINQTAQMQNQAGNQAFNQGLSGSTIYAQNLAEGQTQAFNKDAMQQAQTILGLGTKVGATDIGSQIADQRRKQMESMFPWMLAGQVGGALLPSIAGLF
jgi:ABC-type dipeptide/oligopeptide/nickel transport system permease subunit